MQDKQIINTKTIARLATVQALYAIDISTSSSSAQAVITDIANHYTKEHNYAGDSEEENNIFLSYNKGFFLKLTEESIKHVEKNNKIILEYLKDPYNLDNTNLLLLSILRVGLTEMIYITETPIKVVINEFTNIASSFLGENDVAFINALLDNHAKLIQKDRELANAL